MGSAGLVHPWLPNPERPAPTEVEVTFTSTPAGTRVRVEHRGWERLGTEALEALGGYADGWGMVLDRFASATRAG